MIHNRLYYDIKPLVPWRIRSGIRRQLARRKRDQVRNLWPILPGSESPPEGWSGWPHGKDFAFVLTHDVESPEGLAKCRALMQLEMELGFRSSFNFIPEGAYEVPQALRAELEANGFEVGVHDLKHDGKLFRTRSQFSRNAKQINRYLKDWGAVGFRSAFMFRNFDWLQELNIEYDASGFDTDPFEPQPDGVRTIFPFWVSDGNGAGYVELPYTLPQDSTLFLLFREKNIQLWQTKLDWIAQHGGMALVNVHPDYIAFDGEDAGPRRFPVTHYRGLLTYLRTRYGGRCWSAVPREVATFVRETCRSKRRILQNGRTVVPHANGAPEQKIWIDLDNTPHVPFFLPIIRELEQRGYKVVCTARDAFQVCDLAARKGLPFERIGRHYGKNSIAKLYGLFFRAMQLLPFTLRERPVLAVSHGSRSQIILCNLLGIPSVLLTDYEYAKYPPMMRPKWEMFPEVVSTADACCPPERVRKYPGIKEDVYVSEFRPDPSIRSELGFRDGEVIVTVRPPATEAHYHNADSEPLFFHLMEFLLQRPNVRVVLLPRNERQTRWIQETHPEWLAGSRVVIPQRAVDGLNLLFYCDLVVSGGGTMNREAAALGVPVYSIFRGSIGAVDRHLEQSGRLILIERKEDLEGKIKLVNRPKIFKTLQERPPALDCIVSCINDIRRLENGSHPKRERSELTRV